MEYHEKLFKAASEGDVQLLKQILKENPSVLTDVRLISLGESTLHVATKYEKLSFVRELMKRCPEMAKELNKDGFRPLDIAAILGNLEIVKEFVRIDRGLCLLKGKNQRTALHYAAIKGRVEVVDELLSICPESIKDVTAEKETALHLAVKNYQFDAFSVLLKWLEKLKELSIISCGDSNGLTVLNLAVSTKQPECIELLLDKDSGISKAEDVNTLNHNGLTESDILDVVTINTSGNNIQQETKAEEKIDQCFDSEPSKDWFDYFKFKLQRDSPSDTRNALLVVAALIATVTFQASTNPPSGIVGSSNKSNNDDRTPPGSQGTPPPAYMPPVTTSGLAVVSAMLGSNATAFLFLFANTLGLTASISIIIYLTGGFPFQRELLMSLYSLMFAYGFAVSNVLNEGKVQRQVLGYVLMTLAFVLPFLLRWLPRWAKRVWKKWRAHSTKRYRHFSIEG